jgi:hypothetical protein
VTNADRVLQDAVDHFQAEGTPTVRHLIAAQGSANGERPLSFSKRLLAGDDWGP